MKRVFYGKALLTSALIFFIVKEDNKNIRVVAIFR